MHEELSRVITCIEHVVVSLNKINFTRVPEEYLETHDVLNRIKLKLLHIINLPNTESLNPVTSQRLSVCLIYHLEKLHKLSEESQVKFGEEQQDKLITYKAKFDTIAEYVDLAPFLDKEDLFCISRADLRWQRLRQHSQHVITQRPDLVRKKYEEFMIRVAAGQVVISLAHAEEHPVKKKVIYGLYTMYYALFQKHAVRKAEASYAKPNIEVAQTLWNLVDSWIVKNFMNLMIPNVRLNKVIFLPKTASHVLDKSPKVRSNFSPFSTEGTENTVKVRVLSSSALPCFNQDLTASKLLTCCLPGSESDHSVLYQTLVIHIHGGGFISMSSASHQVYTRKWVNALNLPIISVDYRLAPEHPFPAALDDVWQVYNWLLVNSKEQLGIEPSKVILVGDSAGGNLALTLTYKALQAGVKVPDGIVLGYPAVNLSRRNFTDSLLFTLEDLIVPHTFLKLCLSSYIQDPDLDADSNPYLSPLAIPDEDLQRFPSVRMLVGSSDPLHDDCWRFLEKLLNNQVDAYLKVYEGAVHGCLNLCFKGGIKESNQLVDQMGDWISELLNK